MAADAAGFLYAADASAVSRAGSRVHLVLAGRQISLMRHGARLHAMDTICYHAGGPLTHGDIEDVNGRTCIVCPWHTYRVTLDTGEKLYRATELNPEVCLRCGRADDTTRKLEPVGWRSAGARQRVHEVVERDGAIYVRIGTEPPRELPSDAYARRPPRNTA